MMQRCFFIGHRDAKEDIMPRLMEAVNRLIEREGVKEFVVGRYGKFDQMAAKAVIIAKVNHNDIRLSLMTPYHPAEFRLIKPEGFDDILYPFEQPPPARVAIVRANELVIRRSSHLIAYVYRPGKSRDFLDYARRLNLHIEQINE